MMAHWIPLATIAFGVVLSLALWLRYWILIRQWRRERATAAVAQSGKSGSLMDAVHFSNRLQTDLRSSSPSIPFRCDCGRVVPKFFVERIDKGDGVFGDGQITRCMHCLHGYPYPNDDEIEDVYATRLEEWKASQKSDRR